jgi:hypothetical protein
MQIHANLFRRTPNTLSRVVWTSFPSRKVQSSHSWRVTLKSGHLLLNLTKVRRSEQISELDLVRLVDKCSFVYGSNSTKSNSMRNWRYLTHGWRAAKSTFPSVPALPRTKRAEAELTWAQIHRLTFSDLKCNLWKQTEPLAHWEFSRLVAQTYLLGTWSNVSTDEEFPW